ncbi:MAG: peptidylprolyl isomerase [Gallionellales bacterium RIFCSPLOWO2_12_FULL_59_22]|nr:MAG: peptidylprolyl isomerase [Gallionellales bacterium RIFCSPLOWO2_02_FULL_59_110]OGT01209.1 MAG: peptidylprolyl isomerase [Gallionellales bacterium RIFCSPLOWO2_02_58_13]OGT13366.1 MAG: peptidylprolyl isomerase [Gallionellales bacterium RIFCSPLOWO2_12_FULL_59_22]
MKYEKFAVLAILGALAINPAFAEDKSAALVNGVSIPQSRVDMRVKAATAQGQPDSPDMRKAIREDLINIELLAQEAAKLGLNKDTDVIQQIELAKQQVLAGAYVQDYTKKHPIGEDQLKQEYDKLKTKMGDKEYNARHILVETEAEAKDIIAQLGKKAKFEKLAEKSKDTGSAQRGGELGWAVPSTYVPEFSNAMLNLKKGEYTKQPVQSQFGWHVIRLDDMRDMKAPPFENVKPQLQQRMQQQSIQKAIGDLRAKAKIE